MVTMISSLILLTALVGAVSSEHYHIIPAYVNSSTECQHYPNGTCFTLDQLSSIISDTEDITISFLSGEYLLTWNMTFINRNNITLSSEQLDNLPNRNPRISCAPYTGINVITTDTFTLQGLVIYCCNRIGGSHAIHLLKTKAVIKNSVFQNNLVLGGGAALIFSNDSSVKIDSCVFENNTADRGEVITLRGTVDIVNSTFKHNRAHKYDNGGAVLAVYGISNITNSVFEFNTGSAVSSKWLSAEENSLIITSSMFQHNKVAGYLGVVYVGGGLNAQIRNSTFEYNDGAVIYAKPESKSHINNSIVQYNTAAFFGGVVTIGNGTIFNTVFKHNSGNNPYILFGGGALQVQGSASIVNATFEHNSATVCGGAVSTSTEYNMAVLIITNSIFSNNKASQGGAVCLRKGRITLDSNSMKNNRASYGGAVYLYQSALDISGNVTITNNSATQTGGGIFSLQSTINLKDGHTLVLSNIAQKDGGGVYLTASSFQFTRSEKTLTIEGNTAHNYGGGLYLQDRSQLFYGIGVFTNIRLINNAGIRGGAIYVQDSGSGPVQCSEFADANTSVVRSVLKQCFIQSLNPLYIYFENNSAVESGSDIYGGLLDRCIVDERSYTMNSGIDTFSRAQFSWAPSSGRRYHNSVLSIEQLHNHISSDPIRVCFCQNNVICCNYTHPVIFKKRGETLNLSAVAVDQVGKPVNATLISSLPESNNGRLKEGQQFRHVGCQCTELEYNVYSDQNYALLQIYADGPCGNQGISKQEVNITFQLCTCPIGLDETQYTIECSCDCANELQPYVSNCSPENQTIQINENKWIEHINHTNFSRQFITQTCPFDYCVQKPINISFANQTEVDRQCAFHRTGRLCGQCKQGFSLVFASSRCQQCSNYYLFLLLPFALAGIALVAFILLLNITVAAGTIHGLIFYANILAANHSIFIPFDTPNFLTVFISWLNLDLGIETCFYNGMDSYGKFLLQLVFPVYVFTLIAIIMLLCNRSQRIANLFGKKNPEASLYTLILLSYSKLIRIIITALQFAEIDYPDGQRVFWLYDANVPYYIGSHVPRFLVAFIITIFGVAYTTLLLFGQLFNRFSEYRLMKWTTHRYYIHFTQAHHAPFSDKHRYWVGLLLLARLVHYLISAFVDDSVIILSVGVLAFVLLLHKQNKQIYKKWSIEIMETILITNLGVTAISHFYIQSMDSSSLYILTDFKHQAPKSNQQALTIVSISVSFTAFVGIMLYHILDTCGVKLGELPNKMLTKFRERQHYQPVAIVEEDINEEEDDEVFQLDVLNDYAGNDTDGSENDRNDPTRYMTPPIIRPAVPADQLREPALDDLIPVRPQDYNIPPTPPPRRREPTYTEIDINFGQGRID